MEAQHSILFPLVSTGDPILWDRPIWAASAPASDQGVGLFRRTFTVNDHLEAVQLSIFADTRYEVWVDGKWLGRGPARFSKTLREYDSYSLAGLDNGAHVVAVLVQWAPNTRRSESMAPFLRAHIQGQYPSGERVIIRSDAEWLGVLSGAWEYNAAPVHTWDMIGPTELLDLNLLPENWQALAFDDSAWPAALELDPQALDTITVDANTLTARYAPRSIPQTVQTPVAAALFDAGELSPGRSLLEMGSKNGSTLQITTGAQTSLHIESLVTTPLLADIVHIDGNPLAWSHPDGRPPDVMTATYPLQPGTYDLDIDLSPGDSLPIALSGDHLTLERDTFQQERHAGRRTLLADLQSNWNAVRILGSSPLQFEFLQTPSYLILDLGRVIYGRVEAQVRGPAGTIVDIGWDERLFPYGNRPLPFPGKLLHPEWNQVDSWTLDGNSRRLTTIDARAGRYVLIAVWGQGPVEFESLAFMEEQYATGLQGSFQSSDPDLDAYWRIGIDSIIPNSVDAFTDTPWRERGQWWGDAYVIDQVRRVAFPDEALMARGIRYMNDAFLVAQAPGMVPNNQQLHMLDYSMLWVHSAAKYYRRTDDLALIEEIYPTIQAFLAHLSTFERPGTGVLDLPLAHWSATAYVESRGHPSRYGQSAALNAIYYHTLLQAAYLAEACGDSASAQVWQEKAAQVKTNTNKLLYDWVTGRYYTNYYEGGYFPPTPHAQAWPLAYGMAPDGEQDNIAAALLELLSDDPLTPNLDIYGMYWVLDALGKVGLIDEALNIIDIYYGYQVSHGATTWWEHLSANSTPSASLSHGWGSSPTWFLSTYVLGARQTGVSTWQVKPSFQGVAYASGSIPVGSSILNVSWEAPDCENASVQITADESTTGTLILPNAIQSAISLDGVIIWQDGYAYSPQAISVGDEVHLALDGGAHIIASSRTCPD